MSGHAVDAGVPVAGEVHRRRGSPVYLSGDEKPAFPKAPALHRTDLDDAALVRKTATDPGAQDAFDLRRARPEAMAAPLALPATRERDV